MWHTVVSFANSANLSDFSLHVPPHAYSSSTTLPKLSKLHFSPSHPRQSVVYPYLSFQPNYFGMPYQLRFQISFLSIYLVLVQGSIIHCSSLPPQAIMLHNPSGHHARHSPELSSIGPTQLYVAPLFPTSDSCLSYPFINFPWGSQNNFLKCAAATISLWLETL